MWRRHTRSAPRFDNADRGRAERCVASQAVCEANPGMRHVVVDVADPKSFQASTDPSAAQGDW